MKFEYRIESDSIIYYIIVSKALKHVSLSGVKALNENIAL